MSIQLIYKDRRFWPLFWTQFFGSLNDNVLKNALAVMIAYKGISLWGVHADSLVALAGGIFILPFFLFSALAGVVSDKFERSHLVRIVKVWELLIVIFAGFAFYFQHFEWLFALLFMFGIHSTFFGPIKYSALPDLLKSEELTTGTAYVESGTFLSILLGTILGGVAVSVPQAELVVTILLIAFALLGLASSYFMKPIRIANPNLKIDFHPFRPTVETLKLITEKKVVYNSILGISWFWFFGAGILSILPIYCKDYLMVSEQVVTLLLAAFTIGIGIGSIVCEKLSFGQVEIGLVPLGSIGMSIFLFDLFFIPQAASVAQAETISQFLSHSYGIRVFLDFLMLSMCGGVFIVPLYTLIQQRSDAEKRSRVIAANNIMNAIFMVVSAGMIMGLHALNFTMPQMFVVLAVLNLLVSFYIYSIVPEFALRFLSWVLVHLLYRIRISGLEKIPKDGPVVLVCNHVSYVDWLIIAGCCPRPVRFVMHYKFLEMPMAKYLMRQAKVIPIASQKENPEILEKAFQEISKELKAGEVICIFPEGKITRDGEMNAFRPGVEKIIQTDPSPVVPMALKGLWGSIFSYKDGQALKKIPRRFYFRVDLNIGEPLSTKEANVDLLNQQVRQLLEN